MRKLLVLVFSVTIVACESRAQTPQRGETQGGTTTPTESSGVQASTTPMSHKEEVLRGAGFIITVPPGWSHHVNRTGHWFYPTSARKGTDVARGIIVRTFALPQQGWEADLDALDWAYSLRSYSPMHVGTAKFPSWWQGPDRQYHASYWIARDKKYYRQDTESTQMFALVDKEHNLLLARILFTYADYDSAASKKWSTTESDEWRAFLSVQFERSSAPDETASFGRKFTSRYGFSIGGSDEKIYGDCVRAGIAAGESFPSANCSR